MKMNQAVLARVNKMRERRGFRITDTKSLFYKTCKWLYVLSYIWYILVPIGILFGWWVFPNDVGDGVNLFKKISLSVVMVGTTTAVVFLLKRRHEIGALLNLIFITAGVIVLKDYMHTGQQFNINDSFTEIFGEKILSDYIMRHLLPGLVMLTLCGIMCGIYMREKILLRRDYNKVLEALYVNNKDRFKTGSEEEWEELLAELSDSQVENQLDKYHTQQYLKRKAERMAKEKEKQKDSEEE